MDDLQELRKRRAEEWRLARERDAAVPCNEVNPPSGVTSGTQGSPTASTTGARLMEGSTAGPPTVFQGLSTFFQVLQGGRTEALKAHVANVDATDSQASFGISSVSGVSGQRANATGPDGVDEVPQRSERDQKDTERPCCRICMDSEETPETGKLFSPCRCSGSMRYVHVACLDQWRMVSANDASYYRCEACHYEYRLQRVQFAVLLLSKTVQQVLTVLVLVLSALLLAGLSHMFFPGALDQAIEYLQLPPAARLLFTAEIGKGNAGCWHGGYSYDSCCTDFPGNLRCWDQQNNYATCCNPPGSEWQQWLRVTLVPLFRLLATGGMGLGVIGFAAFVCRSVSEQWGQPNRYWNIAFFAMWLGHFSSVSLGRIVAVVGTALAFKELHSKIGVQAKVVARMIGDRVLEIN